MTTITKALDHLTDVLAGSDVTLKGTKADCIMQLADMIEDGTIVIGGGGGETFKVTFTPNEDYTAWTCDKTLAEVQAAVEAGKLVIGLDNGLALSLIQVDETYVLFGISSFQGPAGDSDTLLYATYSLAADAVTYAEVEYDLSSLVIE